MRFAYIDSNGNEVPIPSVDALALRIELGAITESTELYDAQADEWGPAHTHEIFHTLSRDAAGEDGFVAPPPVAPPPVSPPGGEEEGAEPAPAEQAEEPAEPAPAEEEEAAEAAPGEPRDAQEDEPDSDDSFGLTLAEAPPTAEDETVDGISEAPVEEAGAGADEGGDDLPYLDLETGDESDEEPMDLAPSAEPDDTDEAVFDFGGVEGLEVEEGFEAPEEEPMDPTPSSADDQAGLGADMELETAMEFDAGGFEDDDDSALDLETPMSEFTPGEPPSWMDEEGTTSDDDVLDFSSVNVAAAETAEELAPRPEPSRTPRTKPSPPKFKKQRNLAAPFVGIVLLLAVGIGGYVAWPLVSERLAASGGSDSPEVYLPPLADDLIPVMREASEAAIGSVFEGAASEWAATPRVQQPPSEWLTGRYLASAGDYEQVEAFWSDMRDLVGSVRDIELAAFDAALVGELEVRGVSSTQANAIRERADSGFVAATPDRTAVFDRFEGLVDASLALHDFLTANQENIEYAPASAVTTDPILEVDPATEEIGRAMDDLLGEVLRSLNSLDYRDRPTAAGLRAIIRTRIEEQAVR